MSAKRRLVPESEVRGMLELLRQYGIDLATLVIDIRGDGVTVSPPATESQGDAYEKWANKGGR